MKILIKTESWDHSCFHSLSIKINGEQVFCAHDGEPEDNTLARNFNDCFGIANLMKLAHEAGKRGETFEVEQVEEHDD